MPYGQPSRIGAVDPGIIAIGVGLGGIDSGLLEPIGNIPPAEAEDQYYAWFSEDHLV